MWSLLVNIWCNLVCAMCSFLCVDYCPSIVYPDCGGCCIAITQRKQWAWGRDTATAWFRMDTATPQEERGEAEGWRKLVFVLSVCLEIQLDYLNLFAAKQPVRVFVCLWWAQALSPFLSSLNETYLFVYLCTFLVETFFCATLSKFTLTCVTSEHRMMVKLWMKLLLSVLIMSE